MGAEDLLKQLIKEELDKYKVKYFANCLKLGLKVSDIKEALNISDEDYKTIYPLALKIFNANKTK